MMLGHRAEGITGTESQCQAENATDGQAQY